MNRISLQLIQIKVNHSPVSSPTPFLFSSLVTSLITARITHSLHQDAVQDPTPPPRIDPRPHIRHPNASTNWCSQYRLRVGHQARNADMPSQLHPRMLHPARCAGSQLGM